MVTREQDKSHSGTDQQHIPADLTMRDFRNVVDFFTNFGLYKPNKDFGPATFWLQSPALELQLARQRQVQCVKISCKGDSEALQAESFIPFQVAENHPAMAFIRPCEIPAKLDLSLLMRRYPVAKEWENTDTIDKPYTNYLAKCLLLVPDPEDPHNDRGPFPMADGTVVMM